MTLYPRQLSAAEINYYKQGEQCAEPEPPRRVTIWQAHSSWTVMLLSSAFWLGVALGLRWCGVAW